MTLFLNGLGSTSRARHYARMEGDERLLRCRRRPSGAISGVWQVGIQIPANESTGGNQVSLSAGGVPVRDANLIVWVRSKPHLQPG